MARGISRRLLEGQDTYSIVSVVPDEQAAQLFPGDEQRQVDAAFVLSATMYDWHVRGIPKHLEDDQLEDSLRANAVRFVLRIDAEDRSGNG